MKNMSVLMYKFMGIHVYCIYVARNKYMYLYTQGKNLCSCKKNYNYKESDMKTKHERVKLHH